MRFNSAANWYSGTETPLTDQFDLWSVATHEMGHCLGLDHEDSVDPLPVMRTTLSRGTVIRQLTADDVAGRNSIYSAMRAAPVSVAPPAAPASTGDDGGGGGVASERVTPQMPHPCWPFWGISACPWWCWRSYVSGRTGDGADSLRARLHCHAESNH